MDVAALRDRIQATLDSNADTRRQAEIDLKYVRFATSPPSDMMYTHLYAWNFLGREPTRFRKCAPGYSAGRTG